MQRFFCDLCDKQCAGTPTRRWEHIQGELGLEVVILRGTNPVTNEHLCDECVTKMFWEMIEKTAPNLSIKQLKETLRIKERELNNREQKIILEEQTLTETKQQIAIKEKVISEKEAQLEGVNAVEQIKALKQRETELVRMAEARGRQQTIDEYERKRNKGRL